MKNQRAVSGNSDDAREAHPGRNGTPCRSRPAGRHRIRLRVGGRRGGGGTNPLLTLGPRSIIRRRIRRVPKSRRATLNGDGLTDAAVIGERAGEQHILLYYQNTGGAFRSVVDIPVSDLAVKGIAVG